MTSLKTSTLEKKIISSLRDQNKWWVEFSVSHFLFIFSFLLFVPSFCLFFVNTTYSNHQSAKFILSLILFFFFLVFLINEIRVIRKFFNLQKEDFLKKENFWKHFFFFWLSWKKIEDINYENFLDKQNKCLFLFNEKKEEIKNFDDLLNYKKELIQKYQNLIDTKANNDDLITQQLFHYTQKINEINFEKDWENFSSKTELLNKYEKIFNVYEDILDNKEKKDEISYEIFDGTTINLKQSPQTPQKEEIENNDPIKENN